MEQADRKVVARCQLQEQASSIPSNNTNSSEQSWVINHQSSAASKTKARMGRSASFRWHCKIGFENSRGLQYSVRQWIERVNWFIESDFHVNLFPIFHSPDNKRLPNGSINFCAFNELAAIVSAFTLHMTNVPLTVTCRNEEFDHLVNHIFTCPLKNENGNWKIKVLIDWAISIFILTQNYSPLSKKKLRRLSHITMFPDPCHHYSVQMKLSLSPPMNHHETIKSQSTGNVANNNCHSKSQYQSM